MYPTAPSVSGFDCGTSDTTVEGTSLRDCRVQLDAKVEIEMDMALGLGRFDRTERKPYLRRCPNLDRPFAAAPYPDPPTNWPSVPAQIDSCRYVPVIVHTDEWCRIMEWREYRLLVDGWQPEWRETDAPTVEATGRIRYTADVL